MFQLETPNTRFEYLAICAKCYWGQMSPTVIQGHMGSLSGKNKIIAVPRTLLNYSKT